MTAIATQATIVASVAPLAPSPSDAAASRTPNPIEPSAIEIVTASRARAGRADLVVETLRERSHHGGVVVVAELRRGSRGGAEVVREFVGAARDAAR